ncbi:hypothetical protein D3C71_216550 [compost metagenome]
MSTSHRTQSTRRSKALWISLLILMASSLSLPVMMMFKLHEAAIVGLMVFTVVSILGLNDWAVRTSPPATSKQNPAQASDTSI